MPWYFRKKSQRVMNETSGAGKVHAADKNDKVTSGKRPNIVPENARPNLNDSASHFSEKTSPPETKVRVDRRNSPKRTTKNPNVRHGRDKPRREEDRRHGGTGRSGRRNDSSYPRGGSTVTGQAQAGGGGSFSASPSPQPANREHSGQPDKKTQGIIYRSKLNIFYFIR